MLNGKRENIKLNIASEII